MAKPIPPLTRNIALTLAVIFLIFSAGLFYVNKILLPIQVKAMAIKAAEDALKRKVNFDTIQFSPLKGLVLNGLVIYEKDDPSKIFLRANSASAQILFFALLQKKVIVPSLRIESPEVTLTRTGTNLWNFSDLIPAPDANQAPAAPAGQPSPPMDVIISGFSITAGRIVINDTSLEVPFSEEINIQLVKGSLTLGGMFDISGRILLPATEGTLKFETRIGLRDKSLKVALKANNILLSRYLRFSPAPLPAAITRLNIADTDLTLITQGNGTSVSGNITLPGTDLALTDGTTLKGDLALNKFFAGLNGADITLQGTVQAGKLAITTAAGLQGALGTLQASNVQVSFKDNLLSASADLDVKGLHLKPNAQQDIKADIKIAALAVHQNAKGFNITADVKADNLAMTPAPGQTISGTLSLQRLTANIGQDTIQGKADIGIIGGVYNSENTPAAAVQTDLLAPETRLSFSKGTLEASVHATFKKLSVKASGISVSTDQSSNPPELAAHVTLDPHATAPLNYAGSLDLTGLAISGLPTIGEIKQIQGTVTFATGSAQTKKLALTVLNTPITIAGEVSHFEAPQADITANIEHLNLALAETFIPQIVKEQGLSIKGSAAVNARFKGTLAKPQDGQITATALLTDVSAQSQKMKQSVTALNGLVEYKSNSLAWKDLTLNFQDKSWQTHGSVQNLANPAISASIKTENLNADILAQKTGDNITIDKLSGSYFESNFSVQGKVLLAPEKDPVMDLTSEVKLTLRDLPKMLPAAQAKQVEDLKLAGIIKIKANVKGTPQKWQDLTSSISIATPALYMMGYQIADLDIKAEQKNGSLNPLTLNGTLYGGSLKTVSTISLKEEKFPFTVGLKLEDTNLDLLKKDTPLKQKQLAGMLSATANLKGELLDIRRITGESVVKIAHGYLWDLEILSKVLSILSSSFQGGDVIITDADATFKIQDQKIMTDNLTLRSASVTLMGEGWVDFDQNIDLNISPKLEPNAIPGSSNTANAIALLNPTAGVVNIRIYNTLSAPKFEHNITAPQVIKKTLQNTVGNLLKLFE